MVVDSGAYGNSDRLVKGDTQTSVIGKSKFDDLLIHKNDVPLLMKVVNGTVQSAFYTQNDISAELQKAMDN
jgi:hypothetical protein